MKVSISWLKELVDLKVSNKELITLLPMRTIGLKETNESFLELDMKGYNRADLLSMRGVAREVAAITDSKVNFESVNKYIWEDRDLLEVKVRVENTELCPVYCVAKIEGLKVTKSSEDIVKKLTDSGIRSIDNITDITNLLMIEYGQTMHSFDASKVTDETMIVRLAKKGEQFMTLDGKERKLTEEDMLITDPIGILSLSGIMGGKNSEITAETDTILLEVAIFDPVSIRKTSQRFNLYSEASKRIQHGLTKTNLLQALDAAIKKYGEMGGKLTAITLTGDLEDKPKTVSLRHEKVNSLIGVELSTSEVEQTLRKLGFSLGVLSGSPPKWEVTVPYFRLDINIEEDLIEEVARIYGYEKIPSNELKGELPEKIDQSLPNFIYDLKKTLADAGLTEVQTYSFVSTKVLHALGANEENLKKAVKVANPISSETEYLRTFIWPNLIEVIEKNIKQGYRDIAVFEIGKIYQPGPKESYRLAIALMNGTDNPVEELISLASHLKGVNLKKSGLMKELEVLFHPTKYAIAEVNGKVVGSLAEVHPRFLNHFGIEKRVAILEISIENLV